MKKGQKKINNTIKEVGDYCPECNETPQKNNLNIIIVARQCEEHQEKSSFVKSNGVMVPKNFLGKFEEMMRPVALSLQEI